MKKYLVLITAVLMIMGFISIFYVKGVESYKLNKGYINSEANPEVIYKSGPAQKETAGASTKKENTAANETKDNEGNLGAAESSAGDPDSEAKRQIDPNKPMVALTFDDGPHYENTDNILDSLKKYNGAATFFVLGSRAEKNKEVIKRIVEEGNQIGNHTYDHKQLTKLSSTEITEELTRTSDIIQDIANIRPGLIRPTYGSVNDNVRNYSKEPLILWSIDTLDWKTKDKTKIVNEALKNVKDGDIILMHDIYKTTAMAAEVIIKELDSKGYQLVTIDELFKARGKELENGKVYSNAYK
ncbi:peptidoglycan/xylan/chitin deacetylase (PgdA/CDA1 family) [Ruminiclostridium sufflavum DSM 19573]|uniref:Peptidoglycan/xylan/chitin deacetylase (PgdA/CDA1 family) n=1 Tax=Ruminiclostridium sufflavum DSM 19573 TaxID=1121337 RepID=A0A318XH48_9FIRM|nr:polysaccharide deacetylase family protein [Ruminiclostridium sufflavum]PYG85905.1 peptidoglycan/xylan/chitin deacetylase (PgdA/CDA1 family) [Ruminiclostridium sufflavum DSM 19573]